jgi:ankyrin repeat protein
MNNNREHVILGKKPIYVKPEVFIEVLKSGDIVKASEIINKGTDINYKDKDGLSPIHYASNLFQIVSQLFEKGADLNAKSNENLTALHFASRNNRIDVVRFLLEHGAEINIRSITGITPLMEAVVENHPEIVNILLENGADPNIGSYTDDIIPLHKAASNGNEEIVQMLLDANADVNHFDSEYKTPLFYAVENDNFNVVVQLIMAGANIHIPYNGYSIFDVAKDYSSENIIRYIEELLFTINPMNYKVIGSGGFGAVIMPALPNKNDAGNPQQFGKNTLTKIMLQQKNYTKSLQNAKNIYNKVPSLAIPYTPYEHKYKESNIQNIQGIPGVSKNMATFLQGKAASKDGIYAIRMPNLGSSMADIENSPALLQKVRNMPIDKLCYNVLKLFYIVRNIKDSGYIHGDIRETNVLWNLDTGVFTIIDFDWLMKKDNFFQRFSYFYSHPPEEIFLLAKGMKPTLQDIYDENNFHNFCNRVLTNLININPKMYNHLNKYAEHFMTSKSSNVAQRYKEVVSEILQSMNALYDDAVKIKSPGGFRNDFISTVDKYTELCKSQVDSFGVGIALRTVFRKAFMPPKDANLFQLYKITRKLIEPSLVNRGTIEEAIQELEELIANKYPSIKKQLEEDEEFAGLRGLTTFEDNSVGGRRTGGRRTGGRRTGGRRKTKRVLRKRH